MMCTLSDDHYIALKYDHGLGFLFNLLTMFLFKDLIMTSIRAHEHDDGIIFFIVHAKRVMFLFMMIKDFCKALFFYCLSTSTLFR